MKVFRYSVLAFLVVASCLRKPTSSDGLEGFFRGSMTTSATVGIEYCDTLRVDSTAQGTVTLNLLVKPSGMTLTDSVIKWVPAMEDTGTRTVKIQGIDSAGSCDTLAWTITVPSNDVALHFKDSVGDADTSFVDMTEFHVRITPHKIIATICVRDLPTALVFNQYGVPNEYAEYSWEISFDVNSNGTRDSGDISMSLIAFKSSLSSHDTVSILSGTQQDVWLCESDGTSSAKGGIGAVAEGDSIVMTGDKGANPCLSSVGVHTECYFQAYYTNDGANYMRDLYPDSTNSYWRW